MIDGVGEGVKDILQQCGFELLHDVEAEELAFIVVGGCYLNQAVPIDLGDQAGGCIAIFLFLYFS